VHDGWAVDKLPLGSFDRFENGPCRASGSQVVSMVQAAESRLGNDFHGSVQEPRGFNFVEGQIGMELWRGTPPEPHLDLGVPAALEPVILLTKAEKSVQHVDMLVASLVRVVLAHALQSPQ